MSIHMYIYMSMYMCTCVRMYVYVCIYVVRTPLGACIFRRFVVVFERLHRIAVGCGRRGIRSTCVQVHVSTRGGIARFVVVSERFCPFGRMAWEPQKSAHEAFVGILRFVVVSEPFSACCCVLCWFRTDLGDADVIRIQDLGAGIARFVMVSKKCRASCRTASRPQNEHPRSRNLHRCQPSNVGFLVHPRSRNIHRAPAERVRAQPVTLLPALKAKQCRDRRTAHSSTQHNPKKIFN